MEVDSKGIKENKMYGLIINMGALPWHSGFKCVSVSLWKCLYSFLVG